MKNPEGSFIIWHGRRGIGPRQPPDWNLAAQIRSPFEWSGNQLWPLDHKSSVRILCSEGGVCNDIVSPLHCRSDGHDLMSPNFYTAIWFWPSADRSTVRAPFSLVTYPRQENAVAPAAPMAEPWPAMTVPRHNGPSLNPNGDKLNLEDGEYTSNPHTSAWAK